MATETAAEPSAEPPLDDTAERPGPEPGEARRTGSEWADRLGCSCDTREIEKISDIIKGERVCTDIPWILAYFALCIFTMIVVYIPAWKDGDPYRIIYGMDPWGNTCGRGEMAGRDLIMWPDQNTYGLQLCVSNCSSTLRDDNVVGDNGYESRKYMQYCIPIANGFFDNSEQGGSTWCPYSEFMVIGGSSFLLYALCMVCCVYFNSDDYGWKSGVCGFLALAGGATALGMGASCGSLFSVGNAAAGIEAFNDWAHQIVRQVGDMSTAAPIIIASFVFAVVFGFVFVFLMECCVSILVWTAISLIIFGGFVLGCVFFYNVHTYKDASTQQAQQIMGGISFVFTFIFTCMVIFLRERIMIACEVVKTSSRAVVDLPTLFAFPVIPIIFAVGVTLAYVYTSLYVFSNGDFKSTPMPAELLADVRNQFGETWPDNYNSIDTMGEVGTQSFWWSLLLYLWTINAIIYWAFMCIAGTVADWYFTSRVDGNKVRGDEVNQLAANPVLSSMWRTTRYHLGSIGLAALIIAIIQTIKAMIEYLEEMTDEADNAITKCIFCCFRCFLWCLDCCCRWLGKNALVWQSIYGDSFCESAMASFKLMWDNLARVAMMHLVAGLVINIGKITIFLTSTALAGLIMVYIEPYKSDMSSIIFPIVTIAIMTYTVGWLFMVVYETAVDTVFLCFLVDEQNNKESGTMMADEGLLNLVDKYKADSERVAAKRKREKRIDVGGAEAQTEKL